MSETYSIEDCLYYDTTEYTNVSTNTSDKYFSVGTKPLTVTGDFEASYDMKFTEDSYFGFGKYNDSYNYAVYINPNADTSKTKIRVYTRTTGSSQGNNYDRPSGWNSGYNSFSIKRSNSSIQVYANNSLITTVSSPYGNITDFEFKGDNWKVQTIYVKNIKLKPL